MSTFAGWFGMQAPLVLQMVVLEILRCLLFIVHAKHTRAEADFQQYSEVAEDGTGVHAAAVD